MQRSTDDGSKVTSNPFAKKTPAAAAATAASRENQLPLADSSTSEVCWHFNDPNNKRKKKKTIEKSAAHKEEKGKRKNHDQVSSILGMMSRGKSRALGSSPASHAAPATAKLPLSFKSTPAGKAATASSAGSDGGAKGGGCDGSGQGGGGDDIDELLHDLMMPDEAKGTGAKTAGGGSVGGGASRGPTSISEAAAFTAEAEPAAPMLMAMAE